jgi:hypothetical protein
MHLGLLKNVFIFAALRNFAYKRCVCIKDMKIVLP